jgi:hypothetical protein
VNYKKIKNLRIEGDARLVMYGSKVFVRLPNDVQFVDLSVFRGKLFGCKVQFQENMIAIFLVKSEKVLKDYKKC